MLAALFAYIITLTTSLQSRTMRDFLSEEHIQKRQTQTGTSHRR